MQVLLTVFIGSSNDAVKRLVTPFRSALIEAAGEAGLKLDIRVWRDEDAMPAQRHTLDVILTELARADIGVFFFAHDDELLTGVRNTERSLEPVYVPRDNVVFEAGMFFGRLGLSRTVTLVERGARVPSDFAGIKPHMFSAESDSDRTNYFHIIARQLVKSWLLLEPHSNEHRLALLRDMGYGETIESQRRAIDSREGDLVRGIYEGELSGPIVFDTDACIRAYIEALGSVTKRFCTTTFLESGFWESASGEVMQANNDLMNRLRAQAGAVRRLFLMSKPFERFLSQEGNVIASARKAGDETVVEFRENWFLEREKKISWMLKQGCEVRFAFDDRSLLWEASLSDELKRNSRANDTEIAIFDDRRIDLYHGGQNGHVTRVISFPNLSRAFPVHLERAMDYFESLWQRGTPAETILQDWRGTIDRSKARIDPDSNWLALYEYGLDHRDRTLKEDEFKCVVRSLTNAGLMGKIQSYLDIGTCTARYPIGLFDSGAFAEDAKLVAIDEDTDCIRFSRGKIRDHARIEPRLELIQADFLRDPSEIRGGKFELITCMLGTLSHFGGPSARPSEKMRRTKIVDALENMKKLLAHEGLLLLGNWSDRAARDKRFLEIYRDQDRERLRAWTLSKAELEDCLIQLDLEVVAIHPVPAGMDVFVCQSRL